MNSGESTAGCSSSGRENGDASLDPERPHKKAKFPWQIKGKHHLKNQTNEPTVRSNVTPEEPVTAPPSAERFLITGPLKTPKRTFLELLEEMPGPSNVYPTFEKAARQLEMKEDMCIARWQSTQNILGCFDNTINHVIESWMDSPTLSDENFLARVARLVSDDENVENEGIMMAINAHGLQSMGHPTIAPTSPLPAVPRFHDLSESSSSYEDCEVHTTTDSLPWLPDECANNSEEPANYEPWRPVHDILNTNETDHPDQFATAGEDYEHEFMNTAVIQAIKSKGLMAAGTDFG